MDNTFLGMDISIMHVSIYKKYKGFSDLVRKGYIPKLR